MAPALRFLPSLRVLAYRARQSTVPAADLQGKGRPFPFPNLASKGKLARHSLPEL
jgi:hypothetical protein